MKGRSALLFAADRGEVLPIVTPDNVFIGARVCRHEPTWSLSLPAEHRNSDGGIDKAGTIIAMGNPDEVIVLWVRIFYNVFVYIFLYK